MKKRTKLLLSLLSAGMMWTPVAYGAMTTPHTERAASAALAAPDDQTAPVPVTQVHLIK